MARLERQLPDLPPRRDRGILPPPGICLLLTTGLWVSSACSLINNYDSNVAVIELLLCFAVTFMTIFSIAER